MSAASSNFSAAPTSASAACCGVSKLLAPAVGAAVAAGASFAADCCAAKGTDTDRHGQAPAPTSPGRPESLRFGDVDFILGSYDCRPAIEAAYLRRPPPPLKPAPPPRDPMLEAPRLLLPRAFDPLYPRAPPPKASRFPPPLRERSRLPM